MTSKGDNSYALPITRAGPQRSTIFCTKLNHFAMHDTKRQVNASRVYFKELKLRGKHDMLDGGGLINTCI